MEYKDYYATLGVDKKATDDDIKKAYRRLARKYHPDVSKESNAEEQFKNVQEAYEVLKDADKRKAYNELGANWKAGQDFRPPPGWDPSSRFYTSGGGNGFSEEDLGGGFSDFFSQMFGGGGRSAHGGFRGGHEGFREFKQRGADQQAKISISLEDAFKGTSKTFQLQMPEGIKTLKVNVPAGVSQGQQLRLGHQGAPGIGGGPAGDLYLEIDIQPHRHFTVEGKDVHLNLPVTPWEAALGATINVPTLGGKVGLKLQPGSQSGQKLRLKGRGMPGKPHGGDQFVVLQIFTPAAHTSEQKKLYEKMAQDMPFDPRKDWGA